VAELAAGFRSVHVDFGTGDGAFVLRTARRHPDVLVLGVDANASGLAEASRRAAAKPARGGVPNARFGVLALEHAPGALVGLVGALTVLLPWGSLLGVVAGAEPDGLSRLRALCRPGAGVQIVFGYASEADAAVIGAQRLPDIEPALAGALVGRYRTAGFAVDAATTTREAVRALGTTWANRLAFGSAERSFLALRGTAI
jgi:16S rRNA (adenine(1408)-N(1))-methyltransferase